MPGFRLLKRPLSIFLACAAGTSAAHAEGLQVAPVSVKIIDRSAVMTLTNTGDEVLRAQVRVFEWSQPDGDDQLDPTEDVLASPPFVEIPAGARQVIRLVRYGDSAAVNTCEQTYRVIVDELPEANAAEKPGITYALRYSVPVYLTSPDCDASDVSLAWKVIADGQNAWLDVVNSGSMHAQLASVFLVGASGQRVEISAGLLGYVLPGAHRRFAIPASAETLKGDEQLEVVINGLQTREPVSLVVESH